MRNPFPFLCALCLAAFTGVAGAGECDSLTSLEWLLGEWVADGDESSFHESWTALGPETWEGRGVETSKSDPGKQSSEELRLVEMGGAVFYVAKVVHNELPAAFRLVECGDGQLTFTNPAHDFPRRLDYTRRPNGHLEVRVGDGAGKGFTLDFTRVAASADVERAVLAAEDARFAAMVAADPQAMRRWLADDLAYVHSTGAVETREGLIESIRGGKLRYFTIEPSERRVVVTGRDAAHVIGLARIRAQAGPTTVDFKARYLALYGRSGGDWRLRAWQSQRLPDPEMAK
ncbi:MAG: DUF6265 family protein [Steroidobacteraceae bacterium]